MRTRAHAEEAQEENVGKYNESAIRWQEKKTDNIKRIIIKKINIKTICELIKKYVRNIVAKEQKMPSEFLKNNIKNRAECREWFKRNKLRKKETKKNSIHQAICNDYADIGRFSRSIRNC